MNHIDITIYVHTTTAPNIAAVIFKALCVFFADLSSGSSASSEASLSGNIGIPAPSGMAASDAAVSGLVSVPPNIVSSATISSAASVFTLSLSILLSSVLLFIKSRSSPSHIIPCELTSNIHNIICYITIIQLLIMFKYKRLTHCYLDKLMVTRSGSLLTLIRIV